MAVVAYRKLEVMLRKLAKAVGRSLRILVS
jgi:hypothetical protein